VLALSVTAARGQQPAESSARRANAQNLIVGLLTGQTDYREVSIITNEGAFRVYGQGNSRPFEMLEGTPDRLVIAFKPHGGDAASAAVDLRRPQKIVYQFFRTDRSLISSIILDEADYALFESEAVAAEIANATRNYRILPLPAAANAIEMICYNFKHPILRERAVRQALSYAIRREDIKRRFFTTGADISVGPFVEDSRFFPPTINSYNYNPKKAVELLKSAGWQATNRDGVLVRNGEPLSFRIFYDQSTQLKQDIVRQIKIRWNEININVIPIPLSFSEIQERLRAGNYDAVLLRHRFEETLSSLEEFFSPGFLNYDSPSLQKAFANAKKFQSQGAESFRANMQYIQLLINQDQPVNFLYHPWQTWHAINLVKFENFIDRGGKLKPYHEWQLRLP